MYKTIIILTVSVFLFACRATVPTYDQDQAVELQSGNGLVAFGTNSLDYISSIKFIGDGNKNSAMIKAIEEGTHLRLFQLPAGKYCVLEFVAYQRLYQFNESKPCFYVEEEEINYAGHLVLRSGASRFIHSEDHFFKTMKTKYPQICRRFLGSACDEDA